MTFSEQCLSEIKKLQVGGLSLIEATAIFCEKNDISFEDFNSQIDDNLRFQLTLDAQLNNLIKREYVQGISASVFDV